MKKSFPFRAGPLLLLLLQAWAAQGQSLPNYGFQNVTCPVNNPTNQVTTCVPGWSSSHGTPHIDVDDTGSGLTNVVHMYHEIRETPNDPTAGIFTAVTFPAARATYRLKFLMSHQYGSYPGFVPALRISLATGLVATTITSGANQTEPTATTVWDVNVPLLTPAFDATWTAYTVDIVPPAAGTYQLWMRPLSATGFQFSNQTLDVAGMFIDDVRLTCISDVYFQNTSTLDRYYTSQNFIEAGQAVTSGTQGPVVIQASTPVQFLAVKEIALKDGFSVVPGSEFGATFIDATCYPLFSNRQAGKEVAATATAAKRHLPSAHSRPNPAESLLVASPNPANERVQLPAHLDGVELYKASGVPVRISLPANGLLDVQGLPAGLYLLRMTKEGRTTTQHLQISH